MSGAALDMTLDDLIKTSKKSTGSNRGGGRGGSTRSSGPGPARRPNNRSNNRATPYSAPKCVAVPMLRRVVIGEWWSVGTNITSPAHVLQSTGAFHESKPAQRRPPWNAKCVWKSLILEKNLDIGKYFFYLMIERIMGVYGYPIEIQALFFMALRCAMLLLKQDAPGKEFMERINKRLHCFELSHEKLLLARSEAAQ